MFILANLTLSLGNHSYVTAHCKTPDSFLAVGRHHWSNNKEGKEVEISDSISHEEFEYGSDNYDNDIMLLFLDEPIHDIPIVEINSNSSVPEVKSPVTVIGWGDTDIDWLKFEMSDVLINAEVYVQVSSMTFPCCLISWQSHLFSLSLTRNVRHLRERFAVTLIGMKVVLHKICSVPKQKRLMHATLIQVGVSLSNCGSGADT
jgi:hypothetical protein